ncbi:hypothetical protein [Amycolatopsis sp. SID8362]|uniref:hypothetical protein n=1 Tax=Amycolatopsis sp. SID8362 TaxID=2690346 RepID=UPI001944FC4A|nr:hypothetical protein [Amycolatopsis sp. SID8362]
MRREQLVLRADWISPAAVSLGIAPPAGDALLYRADGLASAGLGLFGALLAVVPFRRRERWAWFALWFYPATGPLDDQRVIPVWPSE